MGPPYFAVAVYPATMGTCVGLSTDGDARVLDREGRAIGGLYAVGNDMASLFRGVYVGPGITLGPALVFAYRAVMHIAKETAVAGSSEHAVGHRGPAFVHAGLQKVQERVYVCRGNVRIVHQIALRVEHG